MVSRQRPNVLATGLGILLAVLLLGVTLKDCAPLCEAKCCPPAACLTLNLSQVPAAVPDAPCTAPAAWLVVLAVLSFFALPFRASPFLSFVPIRFRSDPGRRHAPSRALLSSWTL